MPKTKAPATMDDLLKESPLKTLEVGDLIDAKVISLSKNEAWLDLGVYGAGLVGKREMNPAVDVKVGGTVNASVVDPESNWGFPILSLKKVTKEHGWDSLAEQFESKEILTVYPYDANRGGMLVEVEGIRGFLPVSQLSSEHYPRVSNADKDEILSRLNSLVRQPLKVRILDLDRDQSKLILSEKEAAREDTKQRLAQIKVGDVLDGEVTGTVDFGIFVSASGIEGLIHISEISWERVNNPAELFKIGDKLKAKVIAIDEDKLSLSIKQLSDDPWLKEVDKLKAGDKVKGTITRITPFGAFVQITPSVEALVHISEIGAKDSEPQLSVGDAREFTILEIDDQTRKIALTTKAKATKAAAKAKPAKKTVAKAKTTKKAKT